jgi:hypothetical protein
MGRRGIGYWWERKKEKDHWENHAVGRWTILKWILAWDVVDWIDMDDSCEHGIEPSGSINCWEVLEWLHNWRLLKKGSAP